MTFLKLINDQINRKFYRPVFNNILTNITSYKTYWRKCPGPNTLLALVI